MPPSPRATGRRPRNSLTMESILDAAESVAIEGFDGLTIRAVATELGASPMALYRYFATKDELVDALLDRVLGRFEEPATTDDWFADLHAFARNHYAMLASQPWAITPLVSHPNPGLNALPIGEIALRILARGGITGDDAVVAFSGILAMNYGWASFVSARQDAVETSVQDERTTSAVPARDYPLTGEVADALSQYGSAAHYDRALAQLLQGIQHEAHAGRSRP